ncbi:hypothetical protein Pla110_33670 [Polystyrenella longa]|uniref:Uncharacterized protein n=1 Tax=Polystyrenella longa TaxID=2528007 RepID=A0A518CQZ4_9PLAN|nr:hypothetical protein Pla110_33670 [Polystyrenella longa]
MFFGRRGFGEKSKSIQIGLVVAITNGQLHLGPWEHIFYYEFDGKRRKRILVKIIWGVVIENMNQQIIDQWLQPLYGQPCWGLNYGRQTNLSLNFGEPSLSIREPYCTESSSETVQQQASQRNVTVHGEWWLWLWCCYWQLTLSNEVLATGSSSNKKIEKAISLLSGQKLVAASVNQSSGFTQFQFDLGCELKCRRYGDDNQDELWNLYMPNRYVLSVHGDGTYQIDRPSE